MRVPLPALLAQTIAVGLLTAAAPRAQERPFPDQERFLGEVRAHLQTNASLQSNYIYLETRREQKLDARGGVTQESVKVYESYPGLPGEDRWDRLMSENGRPRDPSELEKELRERQKKAESIAREMVAQPEKLEARQQRERAERRREFDAVIDDIFRVFTIRMERRESLNGHDTIEFALTPRPDAKPRTKDGGQMRSFVVHAWVSESDQQLVRVDAEAVDTVSMGFGLLARLHKGATLSFQRTKVNDEVWLPSRVNYSGSARVGLLAVLRRSGTSDYSNYRRYSVDTSTSYKPPS
jgi:hypothetical protein